MNTLNASKVSSERKNIVFNLQIYELSSTPLVIISDGIISYFFGHDKMNDLFSNLLMKTFWINVIQQ